jgi:hypothetical protein
MIALTTTREKETHMTDPHPRTQTDTGDGSEILPGRESKPPTPRWVKVFGTIAAIVIVVLVIGLLTGQLGPGGRHGPSRHVGAVEMTIA